MGHLAQTPSLQRYVNEYREGMKILAEARRMLQDAVAKVSFMDSDHVCRLAPESDLWDGMRKCEVAANSFELGVHLVVRRMKFSRHPKIHSR